MGILNISYQVKSYFSVIYKQLLCILTSSNLCRIRLQAADAESADNAASCHLGMCRIFLTNFFSTPKMQPWTFYAKEPSSLNFIFYHNKIKKKYE